MSRPLMQHGIGKLEALFVSSKADITVLKQLESELQNRKVPRAVALLAEVQAAMRGTTSAKTLTPVPNPPPVRPLASRQPTLWEQPAKPPAAAATPQAVPRRPATPNRVQEAAAVAKPAQLQAPTMSIEDAYRLLKVTPGSTWESIEQARRQLVQHSNPVRLKAMDPGRRAQVLSEATRVNAAYAVLSQARCGRR